MDNFGNKIYTSLIIYGILIKLYKINKNTEEKFKLRFKKFSQQ